MPSVMDAPRNSAAASNSFSPFTLENRPLDSTQISTGMLRIRMSVMELGRFTKNRRRPGGDTDTTLDYPPRELRTQWRVRWQVNCRVADQPAGNCAQLPRTPFERSRFAADAFACMVSAVVV